MAMVAQNLIMQDKWCIVDQKTYIITNQLVSNGNQGFKMNPASMVSGIQRQNTAQNATCPCPLGSGDNRQYLEQQTSTQAYHKFPGTPSQVFTQTQYGEQNLQRTHPNTCSGQTWVPASTNVGFPMSSTQFYTTGDNTGVCSRHDMTNTAQAPSSPFNKQIKQSRPSGVQPAPVHVGWNNSSTPKHVTGLNCSRTMTEYVPDSTGFCGIYANQRPLQSSQTLQNIQSLQSLQAQQLRTQSLYGSNPTSLNNVASRSSITYSGLQTTLDNITTTTRFSNSTTAHNNCNQHYLLKPPPPLSRHTHSKEGP
ncbi:uncharacterized protein LOC114771989 [Denticeps clupeoides]|uniref:uncharacterized protein LOC114771989 n=1 Tax=Denticeps clupeoides TaxID=299321 RepID=UPI0010A4DDAD|nr:uncharacterized protein LOC114771989 [Denticeps clupeoides]